MNKTIYVPSYFKPLGKNKKVKVPTGEKKKGLFGGEKEVTVEEEQWEQTGWSDRAIDGERLARDIDTAIQTLNEQGYEAVSISMATSGQYDWKQGPMGNQGGYGWGYGYSYTEGAIILARKV
ncbi:MAG: hypothetical protein ACQEV6_07745 [Pseudomonadota bacterium]